MLPHAQMPRFYFIEKARTVEPPVTRRCRARLRQSNGIGATRTHRSCYLRSIMRMVRYRPAMVSRMAAMEMSRPRRRTSRSWSAASP